ncbi:MAG: 30S ribosomal protein S5 [Bacteroidales bacterium]|nr:MAG: 30S ribosomal protein S5 [Bacteroidales bacterium]
MAEYKNRERVEGDSHMEERLVAVNRVTKVTKGGRAFSFAAIVVVGDKNGMVGWGLGKAGEVAAAMQKGADAARKNLIKVPVHKGTIPHEATAHFGGARIILKPASTGSGVKAGGAMRAVLESVGITDILAKSKGSSNPHNLVKATFEALNDLRDPATVAQNRGISVNKVFNG